MEKKKVVRRKGKSKKEEKLLAKEEDLRNIYYFADPVLVSDLWSEDLGGIKKKIIRVEASGQYCYALEDSE